MLKPKVSIIVPVFNVEKYLKECLDSLINQYLEDIEIICVNDGSTDGSLSILEQYSDMDDRIKVFKQENKGQGVARNKGLNEATGEYIAFVDSDDYIDLNMLKKMYEKATKDDLDIVMCQLFPFNDITNEVSDKYFNYYSLNQLEEFTDKIFSFEDLKNDLFTLPVSPCNKIYRRKLLIDNQILFPGGIIFEDNPFFYDSILNSKKISFIQERFYKRRVRKHSSTSTFENMKSFKDILSSFAVSMNVFIKNNLYSRYESLFLNFWIRIISKVRLEMVSDDYKDIYFKEVKKLYKIINISPYLLKQMDEDNQKYYIHTLSSENYKEFSQKIGSNESIDKNNFWNEYNFLNEPILKINVNGHPISTFNTDKELVINLESELMDKILQENYTLKEESLVLKKELDVSRDEVSVLSRELDVSRDTLSRKNNDILIKDKKLEYFYKSYKRPRKQKLISLLYPIYILFKNNKGFKNTINTIRGYRKAKKHKLFIEEYYLKNNFDVLVNGMDPLLHYIYYGENENRKPNPIFDGDYYLKKYSDVRKSGLNPLIHYALFGFYEDRQTMKK